MIVRPTRRASSMSRRRFGTIAIAALTSSPRLAALPWGLTKSFCTSTTSSDASLGSHRSFKLRKISTVASSFSLVIVLSLKPAMSQSHDVCTGNALSGEKPWKESIKRRKRIVEHATGKTHDGSLIQIGHEKHRTGQYRKSVSFHFRAAPPNAFRRLVLRVHRHPPAVHIYFPATWRESNRLVS